MKRGQGEEGFEQGLLGWMERVGVVNVLEGLVGLLDAAVFVVDGDRNVLLWSEQAERLLGFGSEEVLGQHCRKISRCQECMVGCPLVEQRSILRQPLTLYDQGGRAIELEKTALAFFDEGAQFLGGVEVLKPLERLPEGVSDKMSEEGVEQLCDLVSRDARMKAVFRVIRNISETEATVHISGESGTGKELVAQAIHQNSTRVGGPFVAVNCGALTPTLLESELFGHEKGAFTGAVKKHIGLFQQADGGTIFLDEIAELPIDLQAKLLRVLEAKEVFPVGAVKPVRVDIRVISASHRSLKGQVKAGAFREDLMYRLRVVPLHLPPLRERRSDIELLLWHFIRRFNEQGPRQVLSISPEVMRMMLEYDWPGNVRELRNVIEYAFAVSRGTEFQLSDLPLDLLEHEVVEKLPYGAVSLQARGEEEERERIKRALQLNQGNIGKTAEMLGMSRPTLWRKRKKYGL